MQQSVGKLLLLLLGRLRCLISRGTSQPDRPQKQMDDNDDTGHGPVDNNQRWVWRLAAISAGPLPNAF